MISCESTESWKVPLKACQNAIIAHNLVTIRLSVEWPERGGDDPNLVIDITDKRPSVPTFQQKQSSVVVNSVHHHNQQQQYFHHPSSAMHNHEPPNSTTAITTNDHNDVSLTTTTVVYNTMHPQISTSPTMNRPMKNDSKSQLSPVMNRRQLTPNQQYSSPQHMIQIPSTHMNDCRSNMPMSTISPPSSLKQIPSITTHLVDLSQAPTVTSQPSTATYKSLICSCSNPRDIHEHKCPVFNLKRQQPNETIYQPISDGAIAQRASFAPQARSNSAVSMNPSKEPMVTATLVPFPNLMKTSGSSSSSVTTIISQQPQFTNTNQTSSTMKMPFPYTDNNFSPQSLTSSQVRMNNPSSIPMSTIRQQTNIPINSPQRKKRPSKQINLPNHDQTSYQTLNDSQQQQHQQIHFTSTQNHNNPSGVLSSPIHLQQGTFTLPDNPKVYTNSSSDSTQYGSTNDMKGNIPQQRSPPKPVCIRSPVKLDIPASLTSIQTTLSPAEVEQIVFDVSKGEGKICVNRTAIEIGLQKQSFPTLPVRENSGSIPTTTYLSPLNQQQQQLPTYDSVVSTRQFIRPPVTEQNEMNTFLQQQPQQTPNNIAKRNRSKSTTKTPPKRNRKLPSNLTLLTTIPSPYQDISRTITAMSPVTPTMNSIKPISGPVTQMLLSSGCVTTPFAPFRNINQHLPNDLWPPPGIGHHNHMLNNFISTDGQGQINYDNSHNEFQLDDIFASETDGRFEPSTPPPLLPLSSAPISIPIPSQILTPASAERPSSTPTTSLTNVEKIYEEIYEKYLESTMLNSSITGPINDIATYGLTPVECQNHHSLQQQYHSQANDYFESGLPSQTSSPQIIATNSNSIEPMNKNDDVQPSSNQQPKASRKTNLQSNSSNNKPSKHLPKISKQQNRSHSNQKQPSTKLSCTRCGLTRLVDITQHEFPKQKGLVFECVSCGNNSIRSNVSANERQRRLAKVAADHLNTVECQFCHRIFHSHPDYLMHLRDDHASNKPM